MQQNRGVGRGNLRKTIKLLAKSNASLLEWMYLSVMYYENEAFMNQFYALRTALAGKGIIERNTFPSVDFMELLPISSSTKHKRVTKHKKPKGKVFTPERSTDNKLYIGNFDF